MDTKKEDSFEELFKNENLTLANLEKIGSVFLIIGYSYFIYIANLDIQEILEIELPEGLKPSEIIVFAEKLVLFGLIILYTVALNRRNQIAKINLLSGNKIPLGPYDKLTNSYLLSVLANILRVQSFEEISIIVGSGEVFA